MESSTFFFQDSIYQNKKSKPRFSLFGTKRKQLGTNVAFASSYVRGVDSSIFDDSIPYFNNRVKKSNKRYLNTSLFKYSLLFSFTILAIFAIAILVYSFFFLNISVISAVSFQKDVKIDLFLQQHVFESIAVKGEEYAKIPKIMSEVRYQDYIVKNGDTISGIAHKMGLKRIGTIFSANNITNARRIINGSHLIIPSMDGIMYTVEKNDSFESIAKKFKITLESLLDANDINDRELNIGSRLFIPGASLSYEKIRRALGELFIYPLKGRLTSPFGYRKDPFTGRKSFHSGIDLAAPIGTPIKVILDGTVSQMSFSRIFGNYVIVTHENGYQTLYGHVSKFNVKRGQKLVQGEVVAFVGNTGMSTGPHVHLSIYKNGKLVDPLTLLK